MTADHGHEHTTTATAPDVGPTSPPGQEQVAAWSEAEAEAAYRELGRIVLRDQPLGATMHRVAELARNAVRDTQEVSVTLLMKGQPGTVAFAGSRLAPTLDERQYQQGFGPCLDAAATGETIAIEDTTAETRYADFAVLCLEHGVRHTLSIGMPTLHEVTGALNFYGDGTVGPVSEPDLKIAEGFAGYAAVALTNAALFAGALETVAQMKEAMASRAVIEQAKGILMRDQRCTAEEAFDLLREASMRSNRKLRDIALSITEGAARH